jgi:prevent-host-death family protein
LVENNSIIIIPASEQGASQVPRTISVSYAGRHFCTILGYAASGETIIITRHGEPIAQLVPYKRPAADETRLAAWNRLLKTLEEGVHSGNVNFERDLLYDR